MKRIILMRHGQAEEGGDGIPDFERSLTSKGKNITRQMARRLKDKITDPGTLVSSPAFRAIETAMIFAQEYGIKPEKIILDSLIYSRFNQETLFQILKKRGEDTETITLFGHNPSFSNIAIWYSREPVGPIAKSGIVCLSFNIMIWSDLKPASGTPEISYEPKRIL
ncbi:MAG: histidine phosphatase family protein [Bacteroidales bacterium]|jgi:phosphohistidine phosphatase